jgi:hypothetical protein
MPAMPVPTDPWTSYSLYGGLPPVQPTPTGEPDHLPGTPEPTIRTLPRPGGPNPTRNPTMLLVGMIGLATFLIMRLHGRL